MYFYVWVCFISTFFLFCLFVKISSCFPFFSRVEHFPLTLTLWENKISFLQSREFLVSPLRLCECMCIMEWVYGGFAVVGEKTTKEIFVLLYLFVFFFLFAVGMFCFVLPYSLISHILSVELDTLNCTFILSLITFIISYQ